MITILPIKRKWVGEWLKVLHRFICSAIKCFAATYSFISLISPSLLDLHHHASLSMGYKPSIMKKQIIPVNHAAQIKLSYTPRRAKTYIHGARPTYDYLMQIWDKDLIRLQCQYMAIFMDRDRMVIGWRCISTNTYAHRNLDTDMVIAIAATTRAHYIVIANNNPHGDLINTRRDNKLYRNKCKLCRHLGCNLEDQMIICLKLKGAKK